jgi:hypothetical protein
MRLEELEFSAPKVTALPERARDGFRLGKRWSSILLFLVAILPIAVLVRLIGEYGVNVPYGDEWFLIPLYHKWNDHQLTLADLFRPHNEHRIFFPKLIYLAFAQVTHWNIRAEMFFSVLLCCLTSAGLFILLKRTVPGARKHLLLWALINLLIFAPVQAENWLWGFQLQIFIPTVCLVASLVSLGSQLRPGAKFAIASLLATVATFSFGGGILLWPAIGLCLVLQQENRRCLIPWGVSFLFIASLFFVGYDRKLVFGPQTADPLDYLVYFSGFNGVALGRFPFQQPLVLAVIIGASAFLLYLAACILFVKWGGRPLWASAPWLALGMYAIASAGLAAYTRTSSPWGTQQSLASRYASISCNLYIALIGLVAIASHNSGQLKWLSKARVVALFETPFLTAILVLAGVGFMAGVDHMAALSRVELQGLADLEFCKVIPPPNRLRDELMIPNFSTIVQDTDLLDRLQLIHPSFRHSAILLDGENRPKRSTPEFGRTEQMIQTGPDTFEINGWCFLPSIQRPAPRVVLAYRAEEHWIAFALSDIREARPRLAKEMKSKNYLISGWRKVVSSADLPRGVTISAWALDAVAGDVYKLPGDFLLPAQ